MKFKVSRPIFFLILCDIFIFVLITISGFATHNEIDNLTRMPTTFIPFVIAWILIAPFFGLFNEGITSQLNQLWRVLFAVVAVVPLAAWLRGLWLSTPIMPVFVLVLVGVCSLAMLFWRAIYIGLIKWVDH